MPVFGHCGRYVMAFLSVFNRQQALRAEPDECHICFALKMPRWYQARAFDHGPKSTMIVRTRVVTRR
jgi:hypothetical protein